MYSIAIIYLGEPKFEAQNKRILQPVKRLVELTNRDSKEVFYFGRLCPMLSFVVTKETHYLNTFCINWKKMHASRLLMIFLKTTLCP